VPNEVTAQPVPPPPAVPTPPPTQDAPVTPPPSEPAAPTEPLDTPVTVLKLTSAQVVNWPEWRSLATKLGINGEALTTEVSIHVGPGTGAPVRVVHCFQASQKV